MVSKFKDLFSKKGRSNQMAQADWFELGNSHVSKGQWQAALDCFREATHLDPSHSQAHAFEGNVLRQLNQNEDAMAAYERAIALNPDYSEVHYNRGVLLQQAQQTQAALESFELAISTSPSWAEAYLKRGILQQQLGRLDEATGSCQQAIALKPDFLDAYFVLGMMQLEKSNYNDALTSFSVAISLAPNHADSRAGQGIALLAVDRANDAIESLKVASQLSPHSAKIHGNLAQALARVGLIEEARAHHDKAVSLDPLDAAIHFNRGNFISHLKEWLGAIESYQAAIARKSDYADAYCNLGLAQQEAGQMDHALASYSRAIELGASLSTVYNNRGNLFRSQKRFTEAFLDYERAISLDPHSAEAHYNFGQLALLEGNLLKGWPEYEWRGLIEEARVVGPRKFDQPAWSGRESLKGKIILLHAEQGLGDTIQFCRYVPMVASLGARVVLQVQPALGHLLQELEGVQQLILVGSPIPEADYQCSLLSLPGIFKTTLENIPRSVPYLYPDPMKVARWHEVFAGHDKPRIGLAWSGNPLNRNDHSRSVTLSHWMPYLPNRYDYVCLQKAISDGDREIMVSSGQFIGIESHNRDFTDTAALIETLDLVISVDTSLAHLSGALGRTTWIMLPFLPDWRWMVERSDSPWYPSATLYRQPVPRDWRSVMLAIQKDLLRINRSI